MSIVIGVDPDSSKHGLAVYEDGELKALYNMCLYDIIKTFLEPVYFDDALWVVEDVNTNKFVYGRNQHASKAAQSKIAMGVGKCQQAQVELVRMLDVYGMNYELIKPSRGNWAKSKVRFEKVTGWTGRSNEDTRSAAYFGWLALQLTK
jgi:hypothetical protein